MENASDALIIAGGVLIGLLIISLAVYLFASFGVTSKKINDQIDEHKLIEYNAQYTIYDNPDIDITIYDIVKVANIAKENNEYYKDFGDGYKVNVKFNSSKGHEIRENFQDSHVEDYISRFNDVDENGDLIYIFKCARDYLL